MRERERERKKEREGGRERERERERDKGAKASESVCALQMKICPKFLWPELETLRIGLERDKKVC